MTIKECLDYVDASINNTMAREHKIKILSNLDKQIYNDIISTKKGSPDTFNGYDPDRVDENKKLLVPEPYDEMYNYYLMARIHLSLQEINYHNNYMEIYNGLYNQFIYYYNRKYKSKGRDFIRV